MSKTTMTLLVLMFALIFAGTIHAQANERLRFQGRLTDSGGAAITTATDVTFSAYTTPTGGTALWTEVRDSLFKKGSFLSGGQQQRLCIARALAMNPEILLLDEPTSALDPNATAKIEELIVELKKNVTIMMVTHNIAQAARVSDFTSFLYLGDLVEYGTTKQLFTAPKDRRTEEYLTGKFG